MVTASYADKVWEGLTKDPNYVLAYPLLKDAIHPLFGEAIRCFNNDNFHAVAALCRSSAECAVFAAATIYNLEFAYTPSKEQYVSTYKEDDYLYKNTDKPDYGKALLVAKNRGIINSNLEVKIHAIRENGNFVMHYYTQLKKRLTTAINKALSGKTSGKMNTIVTKGEAESSIKNTADTIKGIYTNLLTNPPRFKPESTISKRIVIIGLLTIALLIILLAISVSHISSPSTVGFTIYGLEGAFVFYVYERLSKYLDKPLSKLGNLMTDKVLNMIKFLYCIISFIPSTKRTYFKLFIKNFLVSTITLLIVLALFMLVSILGLAPIDYLSNIFGGLVGAWIFILVLILADFNDY